MKISRIMVTAIGIQCVAVGGALIMAGALAALLPDAPSSHFDQPNHLLPVWLALTAAGALLVYLALERRRAKSLILGFAFASLFAGGLPVGSEYLAWVGEATAGGEAQPIDLKVLQFNVFEGNPQPTMARSSIVKSQADIASLQEPHPEVMSAPELLTAYPYRTPCVGKVCLAAIWSKRPITDWGYDRIIAPGTRPSISLDILWAVTTGPDGKPLRIVATHYGWPWPPGVQQPQRKLLAENLAKFDKESLVLAGDFNSTPWSVAMRRQDRRLQPLQRRTRALYTWPAYVPRIFKPTGFGILPIDHVYAGPAWRTVRVERMARSASDHYPVLVTLRREP